MSSAVLGRDDELARMDPFLDPARGAPQAMVLEGEPGIGKTTLWREACRRAEDRGVRVLACRAAEAEAKLSFSALSDLLEPVGVEVLERLPVPQEHALEVALLRSEPEGPLPDPRAVAAALRSLLLSLSGSAPVLVAIDDAPWLDASSAGAIDFALRRVRDAPIRLLVTRRTGRKARLTLPNALAEAELLSLGPLTLDVVGQLLAARLDEPLPRPVLARVHDAAGGNPFYAYELARTAVERGIHPAEPLSVPDELSELVLRRVRALGPETRDTLLAIAMTARPDEDLLGRALDRDVEAELENAERAGVLDRSRGGLRFAHALYAAAVYSSAPRQRRLQMHTRLADLAEDPEERARHLALASKEPRATVATELTMAARTARARGATEAAAELAELALQRTPEDDSEAPARHADLAEYLFHAGETERARVILEELQSTLRPSAARARVLLLLASIYFEAGPATAARETCERALSEVGDDIELRARIHATAALVLEDDLQGAAQHAREAIVLLGRLEDPDPRLEILALLAFVEAEFYLGHGIDEDAAERALELEKQAPALRVADRFAPALGAFLKYADRLDDARVLLVGALRAAQTEHDESSLPFALSHLPQLELWAGNFEPARRYAKEHLELAERMGQDAQRAQALANLALVEATIGDVDASRAAIAEGLALATVLESHWTEAIFRAPLGFLEWSLGNAEGAVQALERAMELWGGIQLLDPGYGRARADLVEALAATGELERARVVTDEMEDRARALDRPARLAVAERCRAVVAAAIGDWDTATRRLEAALAEHERLPLAFELARTLLVKGQLERRQKRKAAARATLGSALESFDRLGARLWAERARSELAQLGGRPSRPGALTETEQLVAELVAAGRSNAEVARELFMSAKTVEWNLSKIYRKLHVRSRTELAAKLAKRQPIAR